MAPKHSSSFSNFPSLTSVQAGAYDDPEDADIFEQRGEGKDNEDENTCERDMSDVSKRFVSQERLVGVDEKTATSAFPKSHDEDRSDSKFLAKVSTFYGRAGAGKQDNRSCDVEDDDGFHGRLRFRDDDESASVDLVMETPLRPASKKARLSISAETCGMTESRASLREDDAVRLATTLLIRGNSVNSYFPSFGTKDLFGSAPEHAVVTRGYWGDDSQNSDALGEKSGYTNRLVPSKHSSPVLGLLGEESGGIKENMLRDKTGRHREYEKFEGRIHVGADVQEARPTSASSRYSSVSMPSRKDLDNLMDLMESSGALQEAVGTISSDSENLGNKGGQQHFDCGDAEETRLLIRAAEEAELSLTEQQKRLQRHGEQMHAAGERQVAEIGGKHLAQIENSLLIRAVENAERIHRQQQTQVVIPTASQGSSSGSRFSLAATRHRVGILQLEKCLAEVDSHLTGALISLENAMDTLQTHQTHLHAEVRKPAINDGGAEANKRLRTAFLAIGRLREDVERSKAVSVLSM